MTAQQFDLWPELSSSGCMSLPQLYQHKYGCEIPPSCKDVTFIDNAILSPALASLVGDIQVLPATFFATHSPVLFDLVLPHRSLFMPRLRHPQTFVDLCLDSDALSAVGCPEVFNSVDSLSTWGHAVESAVDLALKQGHGTLTSLPPRYRGRCQPLKIAKCPVNSPIRPACPGSFEPSVEILTMFSRRCVTQLRRLESLHRRLKKCEGRPFDFRIHEQLCQEWAAIVRSHAFGCPFLHWLATFEDMDLPAFPLPSVAWVFEAVQITRHFVEVQLHADMKIQRAKHDFEQALDAQTGHKKAFSQVRGPGPPPVTQVVKHVAFEALVVSQEDMLKHDVFASQQQLVDVRLQFPFMIGEVPCQVVSIDLDFVTVSTLGPMDLTSDLAPVSQHQVDIASHEVAAALTSFWQPIWQRDPPTCLDDLESQAAAFMDFVGHVPSCESIPVSLQDLSIWKRAVAKLRTGSARGSDSINAQELKMLPDFALSSLAAVLDSDPAPFGSSFMKGLIAPLSKAGLDLPTKDRTRPITVLPQLYRLWASVVCLQLTCSIATWAPPEIWGFLPNRGAVHAVIQSQFAIERARWKGTRLSGLVLDLQKCFNCLGWIFGYAAMRVCGVPVALLLKWLSAQQSLERLWLLQGNLYPAGSARTGFPEGDQWSVLAMICISIAWVFFCKSVVQDVASLQLSAFADNWSWTAQNPDEHSTLLDATCRFAQAAGVALDWNKTWWWVSSKTIAGSVNQAIARVAPVHVQQKISASDLGFQMQYGLSNHLGILADRLQVGLSRLSRLRAMNASLTVKEHMLVSSVYPAAFHGSEVKPPSGDMFHKYRAAAARALFGEAVTLSSSIALLFGSKGIIDPEHWFVARLLATVRRFLVKLSPDAVTDFLHLASHFLGSLHQVHGPAASLGFVLRNLGWQLDSRGNLSVSTFISVDLLNCSSKRLRRFLDLAWQYQHVLAMTSRASWYQFPDISVSDTRQVLNLFQDPQRQLLVREIAGGYQLSTQKCHWLSHDDGSCSLCGGEDSRRHRLVECPSGAEIREPYRSVLDSVENCGSCLVDFPVIPVYPGMEALRVMHFSFELPTWSPDVLCVLEGQVSLGVVPSFYTDGSCQFPHVVTARYAAFAVILDLCVHDAERIVVADACQFEGDFTRTFQPIAANRSHGEQDILRAELLAICNVCQNYYMGNIYTDSQSAMDLATLALTANSPEQFVNKDHFDLLMKIWIRRTQVHFSLHKVKSHRNFVEISDPMVGYHAMGNAFADATAVTTRDKLIPALVAEHCDLQKHLDADKDALYGIYNLHLKLLADRGRKLAPETQTVPKGHDFRTIWKAFRDWSIVDPAFQLPEPDTSLLQFSSFGQELAKMTCAWLRAFSWGAPDVAPLGYKPGTTWIEMGLSWMCFHSQYLPILRQDSKGSLRVLHVGSYEEAKEQGFSCTEAGTMVEKLLGNVCALIPETMVPSLVRVKVSSLYNLGAPKYYQGFSYRPQLPAQPLLFDLLENILGGTQSGCGLTGTPHIVVDGASGGLLADTWKQRSTRALTAMAKARVRRKRLQR